MTTAAKELRATLTQLMRSRWYAIVGWTAALVRNVQSGYVYHYAFTMILGVFALLTWWTR